jgi:signal transduction histidine kinase
VHEAVQALFEEVDLDANPAHVEAAVRRVRIAVARVTESLREVMRFSAAEARTLIAHIAQIRRSASREAIALNGLSLLLGVVAALWVSRWFRQHDSLAKTHARFLERRANELEVFAQRVAHDLLSPLSALVFCLGAFQRAGESDPKLAHALTQARGCVARARSMVDGIFEFAKAGAAPERGARCEVGEVIAQVAEEVKSTDRRQRPELEIEIAGRPTVACSHGVLVSVLTNLMQNAVKFMSDAPVRRVIVRAREEGPNVRIEVEDTGPGIAPELESVLFEPYVRGQGVTQAGLGLGLATVKRLCEAHGGRVGVRSGFDGSTFWVLLPSVPSPASLPHAPAAVREAG